ncbi:DUF3993 domain-containing protein [Neobacillus niacini]|uniref:DUF3993 domain-containing protein n=1 Tax=Neobacillus niacini TaxID=86668 RepID=UPI000693C380|nr:DUF3993 domain-containing protein [Neobacillus niacini]
MKKSLLILLALILIMPLYPNANVDINTKDEVFKFLNEAFKVQVSLSEQTRTKEEIIDLFNPYFSKNYQKLFWDENIFEEEGKFVTYGSDFALYYIPFFQYTDDTKVIMTPEDIYIIEHFPASSEGPVGYDDHYEGILLKKVDGAWKIDQYLYNNVPNSILKEAFQKD